MCLIFAFFGTALVGELMLASLDAKKNHNSTTCEEAVRLNKMFFFFQNA